MEKKGFVRPSPQLEKVQPKCEKVVNNQGKGKQKMVKALELVGKETKGGKPKSPMEGEGP